MSDARSIVFQPFRLASVEVKSRIFLPAHSYGFSLDVAGLNRYTAYVRRRLDHGVGLVIIGEAEVPFEGSVRTRSSAGRPAGQASQALYEQLGDEAKRTGGVIIEQLFHPGSQVWF